MAYKEYLERIRKRNENIIRYKQEHPGASQRAIAKVFKISQARISKILKEGDGNRPESPPDAPEPKSEGVKGEE